MLLAIGGKCEKASAIAGAFFDLGEVPEDKRV